MADKVRHGTRYGYDAGCRCDPCRLAHNAMRQEQKAVKAAGRERLERIGVCEICGSIDGLVTDHVNGTRVIRGVLCGVCNTGIGKLGDSESGLLRALDYLGREPIIGAYIRPGKGANKPKRGASRHGTHSGYIVDGCRCAECVYGVAKRNRQNLYGITDEQYQALLIGQSGRCAICESPDGRLGVDHIHGTRLVRGLLCDGCNTGLGKLGDTIEGIERALNYLTRDVMTYC